MILLANIFIALGVSGFLASTFALPILAKVFAFFIPKPSAFLREGSIVTLDILCAAYNEESLIVPTLESLYQSSRRSHAKIKFRMGLDHCTDETEIRASSWATQNQVSLEMIQNTNAPGKWNNLKCLIASSQAEWVALVDVGSVWKTGLLSSIHGMLLNPRVMGVAPSYRAVRSGGLEKLSWWLERTLKALESDAGGPVSVHGATVFYRRDQLVQVLDQLGDQLWLNDDVVLPLQMRATFPDLSIVYHSHSNLDAWVRDYGTSEKSFVEYGRRKRMLIGNLQWMKALYLPAFQKNKLAGLLASRRVMRTLWAYWASSLMLGIMLRFVLVFTTPLLGMTIALMAMTLGMKFPLQGGLERLRAAFYAGLELPLHWFNMTRLSSEKIWN